MTTKNKKQQKNNNPRPTPPPTHTQPQKKKRKKRKQNKGAEKRHVSKGARSALVIPLLNGAKPKLLPFLRVFLGLEADQKKNR